MLIVHVEHLLDLFHTLPTSLEQTARDKTPFHGPHAPDPIVHKPMSSPVASPHNQNNSTATS